MKRFIVIAALWLGMCASATTASVCLGQTPVKPIAAAADPSAKSAQVDALFAPIKQSDEPGVAMRSEPVDLGGVKIHRPGTIVGKALEPLASGKGEILVLLTLQ